MTTSTAPNTSANIFGTAAQLRGYTAAVLAQMVSVITPYTTANQPDYAAHVGAHIRHIIEHYDTLVKALTINRSTDHSICMLDYDARERNLEVEANPLEAMLRVALIDAALGSQSGLGEAAMLQIVHVYTRGGLNGEHNFCTPSSVAREMMFLNSHATHHFAILQGYARERGQTLGAGVGKAPATVAHEQRLVKTLVAA